MLKNGGTIYVKMVGKDSPATFSSQTIKVKIAKQAKAPKAKYDFKKDTVAISNGFDFTVATKTGTKYSVADNATWYTVLPFLKDAGTETAEASIVATTSFVPLSKKDENATKTAAENGNKVSYTKYKYKAISVDALMTKLNQNDDFVLAIRKSATEKKPASDVAFIDFKKKTEAPIVYTASNVKDQYDVASTEDFAKKGFLIGTVKNYNGTTGTSGYDDSFALKTSEQGDGVDKNPAAYEYIVINKADENTIDWASASWKKLDPAKTKITGKLKSKYDTATEKGVTAQLSEADLPAQFTANSEIPTGVETLLLVRRAGAKGTTPVRPSKPIKLYVLTDGETSTLYSTVCNGEVAYRYTVDFYKYVKVGDNYKWNKDEATASITGWGKASTEKAKFPAATNADFFLLNEAGNAIEGNKISLTDGKYDVAVEATAKTVKVAIREYANIKVKVFTKLGDADAVAVTAKDVTVAKGKIGTGDVEFYVGSACEIPVTAPSTPAASADDKEVVAATTANTIVGGTFANNKVTVTPASAEEVEVTLTYNFIEQAKTP